MSEEYGCEYTPAHAFNPEVTDDLPKKSSSHATYAAKRGAPTQRLQWSKKSAREFGAEISEGLTPASTWDDVEMALADRGLSLERKGKGLVVGNKVSYAKLSSLGLNITAKGAPQYAPRILGKSRPSIVTVDEIDIIRAFMSFGITDRDDLIKAIREKSADRAKRKTNHRFAGALQTALTGTTLQRFDKPQPSLKSVRQTNRDDINRSRNRG